METNIIINFSIINLFSAKTERISVQFFFSITHVLSRMRYETLYYTVGGSVNIINDKKHEKAKKKNKKPVYPT